MLRNADRDARCASGLIAVVISALLAGLSACGGGGGSATPPPPSPPTISNLQFPSNAVQSASISVQGALDFTDAGGDLSTVTVAVLDGTGHQVSSASTSIAGVAGKTSGHLAGALQVGAPSPGLYTVRVTVADLGGAVSNALSGSFRVSVAADQAAIVASTSPGARQLQVANGFLYWSEAGNNVIKRVPLAGGTVEGLAPKVWNPAALAFSGGDLIWLDDGGPNGVHILNRTTPAGFTTEIARTPVVARFQPTRLLVDGDSAYWVSSSTPPDMYFLMRTVLASGTTTTIAFSNVPIVDIKSRAGTLYWMENLNLQGASSSGALRAVPIAGGAVVTIASGFQSSGDSFALDGTAAYYASVDQPNLPQTVSIVSQPLAGGPPVVLAANVAGPVISLATDGATLAWTDTNYGPGNNSNHVLAMPVGGSAPLQLAASALTPVDLLIIGPDVVWSEGPLNPATQGTPGIRSVPVGGGSVATLYQASDAPQQLALDGNGSICWTEKGANSAYGDGSGRIARLRSVSASDTLMEGFSGDAPAFTIAGTDLIVGDLKRLKRLPVAGGAAETLATGAGLIVSIANDGATAFWDSGAAVWSVPISGGPALQLAPGTGYSRGGVLRLGANGSVYWVANDSNILAVPTTGGATSVIYAGTDVIDGLVVDAAAVYAAAPAFGTLFSVPLAGGTSTLIASTGTLTTYPDVAADSLHSDGAYLYWVDGHQVGRVPVAGGNPDPLVQFTSPVAGQLEHSNMTVDGTRVYWSEPSATDIRSAPNQ